MRRGSYLAALFVAAAAVGELRLEPGALRLALLLPALLYAPGAALLSLTTRAIGDAVDRAALASGLSLAVTSLAGILLVVLPTSYSTATHVALVLGGTSALVLLGLVRRGEPWGARRPDAGTVGAGALLVVALLVIGWVAIHPASGEGDTALSLLGPGGVPDDYPVSLTQGEEGAVFVEVVNRETRTASYRLVEVRDGSPGTAFDFNLSAGSSETRRFAIPAGEPGAHEVVWNLHLDGSVEPYRTVRLAFRSY